MTEKKENIVFIKLNPNSPTPALIAERLKTHNNLAEGLVVQEGVLDAIRAAAKNLFKRLFHEKPSLVFRAHSGNPCAVCQNLDGETYSKSNAPHLPIHPNCKCTLDPIDDPEDELIRTQEGLKEAVQPKLCYVCDKPADYAFNIYLCKEDATEENLVALVKAALDVIKGEGNDAK